MRDDNDVAATWPWRGSRWREGPWQDMTCAAPDLQSPERSYPPERARRVARCGNGARAACFCVLSPAPCPPAACSEQTILCMSARGRGQLLLCYTKYSALACIGVLASWLLWRLLGLPTSHSASQHRVAWCNARSSRDGAIAMMRWSCADKGG